MTTIDCGTLVDGIAGEPRHDVRLRLADGRIDAVGSPDDVDADDEHVEHDVVIPGLIDAHVHLAGLRTLAPMGWVTEDVATLTARATADCRKLLAAGFTSVRDVGSTTGLGLKRAIAEGEIPGPRVYTSGKSISQTAGHGDTHSIPVEWVDEGSALATLAIMHRIVEHGADHEMPEWGLRKAREAYEAHVDSVRRAYEADVPIALGTDFIGPALVPHGENALEAELLVEEIGLSELEAIKAGTSVAARTVPDDDVGRVEAGAKADLVALGADPLEDITALRDVKAVYADGERARL